MIIRWFLSRTVRQASEMRKHILKLLRAQQDILAPQAIGEVMKTTDALGSALRNGSDKKSLEDLTSQMLESAEKWLKRYPNPAWRENVEVFLVAVAIAMGIRTFFLQPMKIPTGSMQPTLYGITYDNLKNDAQARIPNGFQRWIDSWFRGIAYYHFVATEDGSLRMVDYKPKRILPLVYKQRFMVGSQTYTIWFPGDQLFEHAGLSEGMQFRKGEEIMKLRKTSGDHLFVDRFTYHFRRPTRGEIVIFETRGIEGIQQQDTYYIKRLVALGGERVRIGNDQHLVIDGQRLDSSTPRFEFVYNFNSEPKEYQCFGHVNGQTLRRFKPATGMTYFGDDTQEFPVRPDHYLVMGDNTMNSSDSRYWGDFPRDKVIGKSCFVYWPISSRFGWAHR